MLAISETCLSPEYFGLNIFVSIVFFLSTNNVWHSGYYHKVIHSHCGYIIHLVLLKKLFKISAKQIHKFDEL